MKILKTAALITAAAIAAAAIPLHTVKATYSFDTSSDYLYNILSTSNEKDFYNALLAECNRIDDSSEDVGAQTEAVPMLAEGISNPSETVIEVLSLFMNSHPEFFWIGSTPEVSARKIDKKIYYTAKIDILSQYRSGSARQAAKQQIISAVNSYANTAKTKGTDYKSVLYIHDALCADISYDYNNANILENQTVSSAFINKKSVCAGYSRAFSLVCNAAGYDAISVFADNHEWNMVKLGSDWYCVDMTHDDTQSNRYKYFLKNYSAFQTDATGDIHIVSSLKYPHYSNYFPACTASDLGKSHDTAAAVTPAEPVARKTYPNTKILGDANGDKNIDSLDATAILVDYAYDLNGEGSLLPAETSDANGDGRIDAVDATHVLVYYATVLIGDVISFDDYMAGL